MYIRILTLHRINRRLVPMVICELRADNRVFGPRDTQWIISRNVLCYHCSLVYGLVSVCTYSI